MTTETGVSPTRSERRGVVVQGWGLLHQDGILDNGIEINGEMGWRNINGTSARFPSYDTNETNVMSKVGFSYFYWYFFYIFVSTDSDVDSSLSKVEQRWLQGADGAADSPSHADSQKQELMWPSSMSSSPRPNSTPSRRSIKCGRPTTSTYPDILTLHSPLTKY